MSGWEIVNGKWLMGNSVIRFNDYTNKRLHDCTILKFETCNLQFGAFINLLPLIVHYTTIE